MKPPFKKATAKAPPKKAKQTAKTTKATKAPDKEPAKPNPKAIKWWFAVLSKEDSQAIWDRVGDGPLSAKVKTLIADAVISARERGRNEGYFLTWGNLPPAETFKAGTLVVRYHLPSKASTSVNMWLAARCDASSSDGIKRKSWNMLRHIEEFKFNLA